MSIDLEQVQIWLTENKSKIGKPAFLLSLRWRPDIRSDLTEDPLFPLFLRVAIHFEKDNKKLVRYWNDTYSYPLLANVVYKENSSSGTSNMTAVTYLLAKAGYILNIQDKTVLKPADLRVIDHCYHPAEGVYTYTNVFTHEDKLQHTTIALLPASSGHGRTDYVSPMESNTTMTSFTASSLMGSLLSVLNAEGAQQIYTVLMEEKFLDGLSTILEASSLRKLATCLGVTIEELQTQIISAQLEIPRASVDTLLSTGVPVETALMHFYAEKKMGHVEPVPTPVFDLVL